MYFALLFSLIFSSVQVDKLFPPAGIWLSRCTFAMFRIWGVCCEVFHHLKREDTLNVSFKWQLGSGWSEEFAHFALLFFNLSLPLGLEIPFFRSSMCNIQPVPLSDPPKLLNSLLPCCYFAIREWKRHILITISLATCDSLNLICSDAIDPSAAAAAEVASSSSSFHSFSFTFYSRISSSFICLLTLPDPLLVDCWCSFTRK